MKQMLTHQAILLILKTKFNTKKIIAFLTSQRNQKTWLLLDLNDNKYKPSQAIHDKTSKYLLWLAMCIKFKQNKINKSENYRYTKINNFN